MKNKITVFFLITFVVSCVSNKERSLLDTFYKDSFNEVKENWTVSSNEKYFITLRSKPYHLDSDNEICAIKYFSLKKDKESNILPLYEQLINSQISTYYSLNKKKTNCNSISIDKYFYISDISNSDDANFGIFRIAEIITSKEWLKSGKIEYLDEISKKCLQERDLNLESIYESEVSFEHVLYTVDVGCYDQNEYYKIQLLVNENLEQDSFEYRAIDFTDVDSIEG